MRAVANQPYACGLEEMGISRATRSVHVLLGLIRSRLMARRLPRPERTVPSRKGERQSHPCRSERLRQPAARCKAQTSARPEAVARCSAAIPPAIGGASNVAARASTGELFTRIRPLRSWLGAPRYRRTLTVQHVARCSRKIDGSQIDKCRFLSAGKQALVSLVEHSVDGTGFAAADLTSVDLCGRKDAAGRAA